MRQTEKEETRDSVSLDLAYHYHKGYKLWHFAVESHQLDGEMELQIGDRILIDRRRSSLITGYGMNERTKLSGKYPISKVRSFVNKVNYPGFI